MKCNNSDENAGGKKGKNLQGQDRKQKKNKSKPNNKIHMCVAQGHNKRIKNFFKKIKKKNVRFNCTLDQHVPH